MKGLRVKCPSCKKIRHITTEHYRPDETPRGNFLELIDPWKKWKWDCYDDEGNNTSTTPCSLMCCPGCSAPLAPKGRLLVLEPEAVNIEPPSGFICDICGKVCRSKAGLGAHKRSHKKKEA